MFEKALNTLRLERGADREKVRRAYIKMSRRYPPEHFPVKFKQIKDAYEQLSLNWNLVESRVKELLSLRGLDKIMQSIVEEALELADNQANVNEPEELDTYSLEAIVNIGQYEKEVKNILEEICQEQGLGEDS